MLRQLTGSYPPMAAYDQRQHDATAEDLAHILDFLAAALYVEDPSVFTDFVDWTVQVLDAREVPDQALTVGLGIYRRLLHDFPRACHLLGLGVTTVRARHRVAVPDA